MSNWELAQLNIATLIAPIDSPILADFVDELDRINGIADQSPGFIWRLQSEDANATELAHDFGNDVIANASVWKSTEQLHNYVYRSSHAQVMSRRKEWFKVTKDTCTVLWWVPQDHRPALAEARMKLEQLKSRGPTPDAFNFKNPNPPPTPAQIRSRSFQPSDSIRLVPTT